MADYFDSASQSNDAAKASLLQAIATQGSQAKAAFDQAQAQIQAQRTQALAAAVAEAAQRGAPQAVQDQNTATIASGYDRRLADLAAAGASNAGAIAGIGAQGNTYLTEANAAIPALRARQTMANTTAQTSMANRLASLKAQQDMQTQSANRAETQFEQQLQDRKDARAAAEAQAKQAAEDRAAAASQAAQDRQDRLDQQARVDRLQLQIAQANADKANTSAQQQADKQDTKAQAKVQQQQFDAGQSPPQTPKQYATLGKTAATLNKPGQVAAAANYSLPAFGTSQIQNAAANSGALAAKAGTNPDLGNTQVSAAAIKAVSGTKAYKDAVAAAKAARSAGLTPDQLRAAITAGIAKDYPHPYPQTVDVVTAMYAAGQI